MGGEYSTINPADIEIPNLESLLNRDPYLKPYENEIKKR